MKTNNGMMNALKSDFFRVSKFKSVYIGFAIMVGLILLSFITFWISSSIANRIEDPEEQAVILAAIGNGKRYLFSFASIADIEFFIAIICGIFIGKEFSNGTMRTLVARGASRVKLYFSKWLTMVALIVIYALLTLLICGILTAIKGYGEVFDGAQFGLLIRSLVLQILAIVSSASIFVMIAFLCRSSGAAIGASIGVYILISIIIAIVSITTIIQTEGAKNFIAFLDYLPMQQLSLACSFEKYSTAEAVRVVIMPIVYTVISTGIGLLTFVKRDIK